MNFHLQVHSSDSHSLHQFFRFFGHFRPFSEFHLYLEAPPKVYFQTFKKRLSRLCFDFQSQFSWYLLALHLNLWCYCSKGDLPGLFWRFLFFHHLLSRQNRGNFPYRPQKAIFLCYRFANFTSEHYIYYPKTYLLCGEFPVRLVPNFLDFLKDFFHLLCSSWDESKGCYSNLDFWIRECLSLILSTTCYRWLFTQTNSTIEHWEKNFEFPLMNYFFFGSVEIFATLFDYWSSVYYLAKRRLRWRVWLRFQ